jgi:hypothetical protein
MASSTRQEKLDASLGTRDGCGVEFDEVTINLLTLMQADVSGLGAVLS